MDAADRALLTDTLRTALTAAPGGAAERVLADLGWPDLLAGDPDAAVPPVFALLGETGAHAGILNDVVLAAAGRPTGGTLALPATGGRHVVWERTGSTGPTVDGALPLRVLPRDRVGAAAPPQPLAPAVLAAGRRALGWWLLGAGRAMLALARDHAVSRAQFGRPLAAFQAVRHRLAETLVALEGAEAALHAAHDPFTSLLAKAAAGDAALTASRHCQQVLGGMGFTAEHAFHHHARRVLVLDGLLGDTRELTREAGARLRAAAGAPRLLHL